MSVSAQNDVPIKFISPKLNALRKCHIGGQEHHCTSPVGDCLKCSVKRVWCRVAPQDGEDLFFPLQQRAVSEFSYHLLLALLLSRRKFSLLLKASSGVCCFSAAFVWVTRVNSLCSSEWLLCRCCLKLVVLNAALVPLPPKLLSLWITSDYWIIFGIQFNIFPHCRHFSIQSSPWW